MAGQRGFLYEGRVFNKLKSKNLVPAGVTPAGPDASKPDAVFKYNNVSYNLEVKLNLETDYGQGTLEYSQGKWGLGGANTPEADEMRNILNSVGAVQFVNNQWGLMGIPYKGTVMNEQFTPEMVRQDYKRFTDKYLNVPLSSLFNYYAAKNTSYIQIGGYGMYYMGSNPANLPVPQFNGSLRLRIRTKRGGSNPIYNYRFTTALQVTQKPSRSIYNIDNNIDFLISQ